MPDKINGNGTGNSTYEDLLNLTDFHMPTPPQLQDTGYPEITTGRGRAIETDPADLFEQLQNKVNGMGSPLAQSSILPISPSQIDTSGRYPFQRIGEDNEELYAQGQSRGSKIVNALGKGIVLGATTFLQSTAGLVTGLASAAIDRKFSSFYDNAFNRSLDDLNKTLENELPNYYSQAERSASWYSPDYWMTFNFVFDGVIKNLGFAAGAVAAGSLYGAALKALPWVNKLFATGNGAKALAATEEAIASGKASETFGRLKSLSDKFLGGYNGINPGGRAVVSGLGTLGEASFEALHNLNQFRDERIREYTELHGTPPRGEDLTKINEAAEGVGDMSFYLNSALLTATQYFQLPKILGSSYSGEKRIIDEVISKTKGIVKNEAGEFVKAVPTTRFGKILSGGKNFLPYTFSTSEAFEEGAQYAVQLGSQNYYDKKYRTGDADFLSSLGEGIVDTATTDEGMKNVLIGGLSGAIMMGRNRFITNKAIARNTAVAISSFNRKDSQLSNFTKDTLDSAERALAIQEDRETAIKQGDELESRDLEKDYMINYLAPRIKYDRYDLVKDDIDTYKKLASSSSGFEQLQKEGKALPGDTPQAFLKRLDNLERTADNMHSLYQSLNLRYAGLLDPKGERIYTPDVLDKMVYAATKIADYDERIPQLTSSLVLAGLDIPSLLEEARVKEDTLYKDALGKLDTLVNIMGKSVNKDDVDTLRRNLYEARELVARRDFFLKEYSDLKATPANFKESEEDKQLKTDQGPKQTIKVKTKDGEEDLEIGTSYMLGRVVEESAEGKESHRFPELIILGRNEDGTIKIKDMNGIRDISEDKLEDYHLGKVSDVKNNKKASFYRENVNTIYTYNFGKDEEGKRVGRLEWSPKDGKLIFRYKDTKGKTQRMVIDGKAFKAQKGLTTPLIEAVGELTRMQQKTQEELIKEAEAQEETNREERLNIIQQLTKENRERLERVTKKIESNKEQLAKIDEDLSQLSKEIENTPDKNKVKIKKSITVAIRTVNRLNNIKNELERENASLIVEEEELKFNLAYFEDVAQNVSNFEGTTQEVRDELAQQVTDLESLISNTSSSISKMGKFIKDLERGMEKALDLVRFLWERFEKKAGKSPTGQGWAEFINTTPDFLTFASPDFKEDLQWVLDTTSDIEALDEVPFKKEWIDDVAESISKLTTQLNDLTKEYIAKKAIYDRFAQIANEQEAAAKAKEEFEANLKLHNELFTSQTALGKTSGDIITPPPGDVTGNDWQGKKKPFSHIASTTDASADDAQGDTPERRRNWQFLSNFKDLSEEKQRNTRVITVTQANEEILGLKGLTSYKMGTNPDVLSPDKGFIATVFVEEEKSPNGNSYYFLDVNGDRLGKVGETTDIQTIVYSTLSSTDIESGKWGKRYISKDSDQGSPEDYINAWRKTRADLIEQSKRGDTNIFQFSISRGIPQENKVNDKFESNPVVGTLIKSSDLNERVIEVITTGKIDHRGNTYNFPVGKVVLVHEDTLQFLNNRNFSQEEAENIYNILVQVAKESEELHQAKKPAGLNKQAINFLQGIIHFGSPRDLNGKPVPPARNQIWVQGGKIHFGKNDKTVNFFPKEMEDNKALIMSFLTGMYNNINNHYLKPDNFNTPFTEIIGVNKDGTFKTIQWKTYQHFLLSSTYDLVDSSTSPLKGKARPQPHLTTSVRKRMNKEDVNYVQKYITLTTNLPLEDTRKKKQEEKKTPPPTQTRKDEVKKPVQQAAAPTINTQEAQTPPILQAGGYVFDGKTFNKFPTKGGDVEFTATYDPETGGLTVIYVGETFTKAAEFLAPRAKEVAKLGDIPIVDKDTGELKDDLTIAKEVINSSIKGKLEEALLSLSAPEAKAEQQLTKQVIEEVPFEGGTVVTGGAVKGLTDEELEKVLKEAASKRKGKKDADLFRRVIDDIIDVQKENWKEVEAWVKENLPNVPLNKLQNLIHTTDGGRAWGVFSDAAIYVYENAEVGTTYHEAFEAVWGMFTTSSERKSMIREFRKRGGKFIDRPTQQELLHKDASELQIKEQLAEEFRDYKLTGTKPPINREGNFIVRFFKDLINTIRNFILKGTSVEDFFKRIDKGYYKNTPVNIRNLYPANESYRLVVDGWNAQTTNDVMEGVLAIFMSKLSAPDSGFSIVELEEGSVSTKEVYDIVFESIQEQYDEILGTYHDAIVANPQHKKQLLEESRKFQILREDIGANWEQIVRENNQRLLAYGIVNEEVGDDVEGGEVESDREVNVNNEERNGKEDHLRDVMKIDGKKNASASVKLLIASLMQTEYKAAVRSNVLSISKQAASIAALQTPPILRSSVGLPKLVNFAKTFNHIMHSVTGIHTLGKMIERVGELAKSYPNYVRLFTRLKGSLQTGKLDYSNLTLNDWKLLTEFFNVFAKQKPKALLQIINEDGTVYTQNANSADAISSVVSGWIHEMGALYRKPKSLILFDRKNKVFVIDAKEIPTNANKPEQRIAFLEKIGISFPLEKYNTLSTELKDEFNRAVSSIMFQLKRSPSIITVEGKTLSITGPLNTLAGVLVRADGDFSESTFMDVKGEKIQAFVQHNYPSLFLADFNSVSTREELFALQPQLRDVWSRDSEILKLGGRFFTEEGNRKMEAPLDLGYINGTVEKGKRGKHTSELSLIQRTVQEVNQNLKGRYFGLVPADSKTEWLFSFGNFIEYPEVLDVGVWNKIYNRFTSYLQTEILLAQVSEERNKNINLEDKGNHLRFFKNILPSQEVREIQKLIDTKASEKSIEAYLAQGKTKQAIDDAVKAFILKERDKLKEQLTSFNEIRMNVEVGGLIFPRLDDDFRLNNKLGHKLTEKDIDDILLLRTVNYTVSNIEMFKILFGDPALIKDHTKRIKSFQSGTETPIHDSEEFDVWHTSNLNNVGGVELTPDDFGYRRFKNFLRTATLQDIRSDGDIYNNTNEADAQTWMMDGAYRELLLKHGKWTDKLEQQFQYEMAWTRNYLDEYSSEELREADLSLLEKGNPDSASFPIIKPKGSGQKHDTSFMDLYLDKTSACPVFLRHIVEASPNSNLHKMYLKMWNQEIDYIIVESGRKVGAQTLHKVYNADGSFNTSDFEEDSIINIPFKNYGIQVETLHSKNSQTLGSQLTKLATMDLMLAGVPITFKGDLAAWDSLSEEEKLQNDIYSKVRKNQKLLEDLSQNGYEKILRKLGITDNGTSFSTKDKKKIFAYINNELRRRNTDENTIDGISINEETQELSFPIEASPKYIQIKNLLYSLVDKNIASPKVSGGSKTMLSSSMRESGDREVRNERLRVSSLLKFYTRESPYMEIMVPHWFRKKLEDKGFKGDDKQLLEQLKDSGILRGIGFRIPTQALSSIDTFKIVGFLPQAMGDTVIVPAELTVKSGSDFDVDKLNTYLKNIEVDKKGKIHSIEYKGSKEATIDFYTKKFNSLLEKKKENAAAFLDAVVFSLEGIGDEANFERHQALLDEIFTDKTLEEAMKTLENLDEKKQASIRERYVRKMYDASLENAYFESLEELLTLPENFDRLTSQNTDKTLKGIRDDLQKIELTDEEYSNLTSKNNFSLLISPSYMAETRHNFMVGKAGVGIAAIHQTGHSLNQRSPMYVNTDNISSLSEEDRRIVGDGSIRLPHNTLTINGKKYPSLSHVVDRAGKYISDKISEYINGYVDIAKDAFIIEIGATTNTASTYMFLEKVGVPTRDVVLFMRQPIIREFLKALSIKGWSGIVNTGLADDIAEKFGGVAADEIELDTRNFEKNIRKYYKEGGIDKFTQEEKEEQVQILREFQKYALMAQDLEDVMRGASYDTTQYSDSNQHVFKEQQTEIAREGNLISSIDNIFNNSFVGERRRLLGRSIEAISEAVPMKLSTPFIRSILDPIKRIFGRKGSFINEKTKLTIAKKIELSFIDYILQTRKGLLFERPLGEVIDHLMLNEKSAVAYELDDLKKGMGEKEFSDLANNPILVELEMAPGNRVGKPVNVRLKSKDNDKYTSDLYTGALRELRDNARTHKLYFKLIRLSMLQSGVGRTFYSFGHLIPVEDYQRAISPLLENLEGDTKLYDYIKNYAFFRNNWQDEELVPTVKPKWYVDRYAPPKYDQATGRMQFDYYSFMFKDVPNSIRNLAETNVRKRLDFIAVDTQYYRAATQRSVIKLEKNGVNPATGLAYEPYDIAQMKARGDFSYQDYTLYARVEENGEPLKLTIQYKSKGETKEKEVVIYKAINAWGNGLYAQEYYEGPRQSAYNNGTTKFPKEYTDKQIFKAYRDGIGLSLPDKTQPMTQQISPISQSIRDEITTKLATVIKDSARKHLPKEQVKSKIATQYIGDGPSNSSTGAYKTLYEGYGIANTGNYSASDIIWVSSNGKRANRVNPVANGELQGVYKNIDKAIAAGATIVMDTAQHIKNTASYNIGEIALAEYLSSNGYKREENSGIWKPSPDMLQIENKSFDDFKNSLKRKDC